MELSVEQSQHNYGRLMLRRGAASIFSTYQKSSNTSAVAAKAIKPQITIDSIDVFYVFEFFCFILFKDLKT